MKFKVLGPLTVIADGTEVTPKSVKLRSLIALLSVNSGCVVSVAQLTEALWPENPPRTAPTALQVYVSKLRRHFESAAVGSPFILTRAPGYLLTLDGHDLDLREFDTLTSGARTAMETGRLQEALESLTAASALWNGPVLADLSGNVVFDNIARQIEERRLLAYEQRFDLELLLGRQRRIVGELYGLIAEYPTWETINWYLMIALYRSGRVAESLSVYQEVRNSYVSRLGMEPGRRLRQLHAAILARDPWLDDPSLKYVA
ncbi:BTAD domain-containing putative transcriptional regulator [Streptomyces sp. NPDC019531]|uniref:AfsR/SARP family transcriptional regulator n=1 Tax=Streptomyces sp. NPDC019531 TaxID=3365062 RepID=UPI00384C20DD